MRLCQRAEQDGPCRSLKVRMRPQLSKGPRCQIARAELHGFAAGLRGAFLAYPWSMNAIAFLTRQHRELEAELNALLESAGSERPLGFRAMADRLMAHVMVEEEIFYPAVKAKRTEDILLEALEEHLSLKRLLADLVELRADDAHFEPKLHVLKEQAEHHHQEEEQHLFPKVEKLLSGADLTELGQKMVRREGELLRERPREHALDQRDAAAPLR